MTIPRAFLVIGTLFLVLGIGLGSHMGSSGDHTLAPLHAHINLLGFAVMAIFGLVYHAYPAMAASGLARAHLGLHVAGSLLLLVLLFLLMTGRMAEESMFPWAPVAEVAVLAGVIVFLVNLLRNGR